MFPPSAELQTPLVCVCIGTWTRRQVHGVCWEQLWLSPGWVIHTQIFGGSSSSVWGSVGTSQGREDGEQGQGTPSCPSVPRAAFCQ